MAGPQRPSGGTRPFPGGSETTVWPRLPLRSRSRGLAQSRLPPPLLPRQREGGRRWEMVRRRDSGAIESEGRGQARSEKISAHPLTPPPGLRGLRKMERRRAMVFLSSRGRWALHTFWHLQEMGATHLFQLRERRPQRPGNSLRVPGGGRGGHQPFTKYWIEPLLNSLKRLESVMGF